MVHVNIECGVSDEDHSLNCKGRVIDIGAEILKNVMPGDYSMASTVKEIAASDRSETEKLLVMLTFMSNLERIYGKYKFFNQILGD